MSKVKIKTSAPVKVVIGPTEPLPSGLNPPNPADQLRLGSVPIRTTPDQTLRRPFSVPYKPSLHRNEGLSNDEFNQPTRDPEGESGWDSVGTDANKYSKGPNKPTTDEGEYIKGT